MRCSQRVIGWLEIFSAFFIQSRKLVRASVTRRTGPLIPQAWLTRPPESADSRRHFVSHFLHQALRAAQDAPSGLGSICPDSLHSSRSCPTRSRVDETQSGRSFGTSGKRLVQQDGSGPSQTDMALKIVKGSIDRMFDKNLQDLVRGIRNHKEDEVKRPPSKHPGLEAFQPTFTDVFSKFAHDSRVAFYVDQLAKTLGKLTSGRLVS